MVMGVGDYCFHILFSSRGRENAGQDFGFIVATFLSEDRILALLAVTLYLLGLCTGGV